MSFFTLESNPKTIPTVIADKMWVINSNIPIEVLERALFQQFQ